MNQKALFYLLISAIASGMLTVVTKAGLNAGLDPFFFAMFTITIGGFISFIYLIPQRKALKKIKNREWSYILIIGLIASGIAYIFVYIGQALTTAINTGFIVSLVSITTIPFSYILVKEKFQKRKLIFIFITLFGVFILTTEGRLTTPNTGDLWLIFSMILYGYTNALSKKAMRNASGYIVSALRVVIGSLFLLVFVPLIIKSNISSNLSTGIIFVIPNSILMLATIMFFYKGIELTNPGISASIMLLSPLISTALAFIFLRETLSLIQGIGGILILTGIYSLIKPNKIKI